MMSDKSKTQGRHGERDSQASNLSHEALKLLKTQDAGYLRVIGERARRELEQVEREVKLQEGMEKVDEKSFNGGKGGKIVFVDDKDEQRQRAADQEEESDEDDDEEVEVKETRKKSKKEIEVEKQAIMEVRAARRLKKRAGEVRRNKLLALQKRHQDILAAEQELEWQRARMENSVGGVNKNGVKWKIRERKK